MTSEGFARTKCPGCEDTHTPLIEKDPLTKEKTYQKYCEECVEKNPILATEITFID